MCIYAYLHIYIERERAREGCTDGQIDISTYKHLHI